MPTIALVQGMCSCGWLFDREIYNTFPFTKSSSIDLHHLPNLKSGADNVDNQYVIPGKIITILFEHETLY